MSHPAGVLKAIQRVLEEISNSKDLGGTRLALEDSRESRLCSKVTCHASDSVVTFLHVYYLQFDYLNRTGHKLFSYPRQVAHRAQPSADD